MATAFGQYQTGTTSTTGNQQSTQQTANQNTYGANQSSLQSLIPMLYSQLLGGGGVPSAFTNSPALNQQFQSQFSNTVAPQLAAQYGPGSPQIASQEALGEVNLQGNEYMQGVQNYLQTLSGGQGAAFTPTGGTGASVGNTNSNQVMSLLAAMTGFGL